MNDHRSRACLETLQRFFSGNSSVLEWGVTPARLSPNAANLRAWVAGGRHGSLEYMAARLSERENPKAFHGWAESVVMFAFPYGNSLGLTGGPYQVAAYAGSEDYHQVARGLLREAEGFLRQGSGLSEVRFYGFVDTAPVFERDLASEAGIGWRGKNCCTLNRTHGSAFHLAGFFLDIPLAPSAPVEDFCGGCTRCLDACPTQAFDGPGKLDATKCISYWTIEAKGEVPPALSEKFGGWIFGCDICQEVCPWNHKPIRKIGRNTHTGIRGAVTGVAEDRPEDGPAWLTLLRKGGGFQSRYKHSPLTRAGRKALVRNLAIAARNLGDTSMIAPLREMLPEESDPAVRAEIERSISYLKRLD
jgi:epoxyqueuosine reductase